MTHDKLADALKVFERIMVGRQNRPIACGFEFANGVRVEVFYHDETSEDYEAAVAATGERIC